MGKTDRQQATQGEKQQTCPRHLSPQASMFLGWSIVCPVSTTADQPSPKAFKRRLAATNRKAASAGQQMEGMFIAYLATEANYSPVMQSVYLVLRSCSSRPDAVEAQAV